MSAWSLILGTWAPALFPSFAIHGVHLAFMGGFGLMTLMIASRVTLAHGGYGLELEANSKAIAITGVLILFAAATRVTAILIPNSYLPHLAYAAMIWIIALGVWSWSFIPRMLMKSKAADQESC